MASGALTSNKNDALTISHFFRCYAAAAVLSSFGSGRRLHFLVGFVVMVIVFVMIVVVIVMVVARVVVVLVVVVLLVCCGFVCYSFSSSSS